MATLDSICSRVSSGGTPSRKRAEFFTADVGGHLWVKSKELLDCAIDDTEEKISLEGLNNSAAKYFPEHSVLIAMYGANVGQLGWLRRRATVNQAICGLVIDESQADWRFVFYALLHTRGDLTIQAQGAAQQNLNQDLVRQFAIPLPPLPLQRRIAGILSAYDELIENCQRRIRILEAMARALYREWFVHLRFPGHETHPRVASAIGEFPKGWDVAKLGDHLAALESGKRPRGGIRDVEDGVPSIGAENIDGIGRHNFAGEKFIPREFFQGMRSGVVRDRDVAVYKDGAYIGKSSYFRDGYPHAECCVNEHVFLLRADGDRLKQNALYLWLQEPDTVQVIRSKNANAAQPGINQQTIGGLELILPDEHTAAHFDTLIESPLAQIINLFKQIKNLRLTRDLLLPRLLSGQVEVDVGAA